MIKPAKTFRRLEDVPVPSVLLFGLRFVQRFLESANPFAQTFSELRKLFGAEGKHGDYEDNQQMHWLK